MVINTPEANARHIALDLEWFTRVTEMRMESVRDGAGGAESITSLQPPALEKEESYYTGLIRHYHLDFYERLLLVMALVPHVKPGLLDPFFALNRELNRGFSEFGGLQGKQHGGFLPTGESFLFLAAGNDLEMRFSLQRLFDAEHFFTAHRILWLEPAPLEEPATSGSIVLSRDVVDYITTGTASKPDMSMQFPARRISTDLTWEDLILDPSTLEQLGEIKAWLEHGDTLLGEWGLGKRVRKGYRSLFHGPPGTGKSLTAALLGKYTGRDVYCIDLSMVVSKYIGETEKNLARIFEKAEHKDWILFFDEADALFGKRTEVKDSHDRYANQEVSYLLQRIEIHDGVVILASNMKSNLDDSFTRRFESIINFPMPRDKERIRLWQNGFSDKSQLADNVDLESISKEFELSGGAIMNAIRYSSLMALKEKTRVISLENLREGIRKEYQKEGRTI